MVGLAVLLLVLVVAGAWYWLASADDDDASLTPTAAADTAATDAAADSAADLPPLDASDELVRRTAAELSSRPQLAEWLATEDLARRFVGSVVTVASGRSPRDELAFMEPEGDFQVRGDTARAVDPATYRRYDPIVATFVSLDTQGTAELYRRLRPLFQQAYRDLGFREGSFDGTMARAVEELLAVPVREEPVAVVPGGATGFVYRDSTLEALSPAQKHLLRMGPENVRRVQSKLRELADAIDLPVVEGRRE